MNDMKKGNNKNTIINYILFLCLGAKGRLAEFGFLGQNDFLFFGIC